MKIKAIILLLILFVGVYSKVKSVEIPQVNVYYAQGRDEKWYAYCLDRCRDLLDVATVDQLATGFDTFEDAVHFYAGTLVPRLLALPDDRDPLRAPPLFPPAGVP